MEVTNLYWYDSSKLVAELNQLKIGAILNYVNMALGSLIPLFYTPVMLRILGQEEYGLYKLSGTITGYLGLLSLGIGGAIIRNLVKARTEGGHDEEQRVFSLFVMLYRFIAIATLVVGAVLTYNLDIWYGDSIPSESMFKMKVLVVIMVCQSALCLVMGPYYSIIASHERFIFEQSVGIFFTCFAPALNLVALLMGYASIGLAVTSFISSFLGQIVNMFYVVRILDIRVQWKGLPWGLTKAIFSFSFWLFLGEITGLLYNSTDNLLIGSRAELGTKAVAVYSIGCILTGMIFSFTTGISSVLAPRINKMCFEGASNDELTDFAIKIGRLQFIIVTFVISGFIVFGLQFIALYAGDNYGDAYWVTIVTIIPLTVSLVQNVFLNVAMAKFMHQFRAIVYLIVAIVNVIGTYLILPYMGIIGAAIVTGIAGVCGYGIAMNWFYYKKMNLDIPRFWKGLSRIIIFPLALCIITVPLISQFQLSFPILCVDIVIYATILFVLQYYFVLNKSEKSLFLSPINKLLKSKLFRVEKD